VLNQFYNITMALEELENLESIGHLDINTLVILIAIASLVAVVVKRIKIPYTAALVVVGLGLAFFKALKPIPLTEELVLFIFLPALLFEAAWNLDLKHLRNAITGITLLATLGVALSIFIIGACLNYFLNMPWLIALIFGAIIAPTDPVSVVAVMKKMHLNHKISALVEAESLSNDGTSVVFFKLLLALLINYGLNVPATAINSYLINGFVQFMVVVIGAAILGTLMGLCFSIVTKFFDDHALELTFTTLVAYGSFLLAEAISVPGEIQGLHLSGVVATVAAGLVMGNYGRHVGMSASTKIVVSSFWEYAAFFMNSLIFLLIGLEIQISSLISNWYPILIAIFAVLLARLLSIYSLLTITNLTKLTKFPVAWKHTLVMSGLKGALSMALVLSIPRDLIASDIRELLILMIFGVVVFTLIPQGLCISFLLKLLKLGVDHNPDLEKYQLTKAKLKTAKLSLQALNELQNNGEVLKAVARTLRDELEEEIKELIEVLESIHISNELILLEDTIETKVLLLKNRKAIINDLVTRGALSSGAADELRAKYDSELEGFAR
jgi:monovalent cation:H+ antiporter, CPA1 family